MRKLNVLIACEFSGVVREAFIAAGHNAISCDLLPTESPGPHHQGDVLQLIAANPSRWDAMIAHPPCTRLTNAGVRWLWRGGRMPADDAELTPETRDEVMWQAMLEGVAFFNALWACDIPRKCLENPIMHCYARSRLLSGITEPQIVQPWQFGHREMKATGLYLQNLPPLVETDRVGPPPRGVARKAWARVHRESPGPDRWKARSRFLPGIAKAMAAQWGGLTT